MHYLVFRDPFILTTLKQDFSFYGFGKGNSRNMGRPTQGHMARKMQVVDWTWVL